MSNIFKKSFLEGYASNNITIYSVAAALFTTLIIAMYIFLVYRTMTRKSFYSKNFNISLVGVALITSAIIVTIQSSIVVSLGMVGALSIVRFRTAIKEPLDLMFLFWAISVGIICGAGFAMYAVMLSVVLTVAVYCLNKAAVLKQPMILVINSADIDSERRILDKISEYEKNASVKSRNLTSSSLDLTVELRTDRGGELVRDLMRLEGITSAGLISHDGEVSF